MTNRETALACLAQIDPCRLDYGQWLAVGMGLKGADAALADWDSWSSRDSDRYRTNGCAAKWNGFGMAGAGRSVGVGTLVKLCRDHGGTVLCGEYPSASRFRLPPRPPPPLVDYDKARAAIIARGGGSVDPDDADLWEASPYRLDWPPEQDTAHFLRLLFAPEECVYIGPAYGKGPEHVKAAGEWVDFFESQAAHLATLDGPEREHAEVILGMNYPHFIANPLTGKEGLTKAGGPSYRADSCVASFRWLVAEFDTITKGEQVAFFRGLGLPCSALIDTGGKSIHALLRVDARDAAEWEAKVEGRMFTTLTGLGLDCTCKNESRMSRLPGVRRLKADPKGVLHDTGKFQKLIWLSKDGELIS